MVPAIASNKVDEAAGTMDQGAELSAVFRVEMSSSGAASGRLQCDSGILCLAGNAARITVSFIIRPGL